MPRGCPILLGIFDVCPEKRNVHSERPSLPGREWPQTPKDAAPFKGGRHARTKPCCTCARRRSRPVHLPTSVPPQARRLPLWHTLGCACSRYCRDPSSRPVEGTRGTRQPELRPDPASLVADPSLHGDRPPLPRPDLRLSVTCISYHIRYKSPDAQPPPHVLW